MEYNLPFDFRRKGIYENRRRAVAKERHSVLRNLVRNKPTAYGRATLGATPFRRAPVRTSSEVSMDVVKRESLHGAL